MRRPSGTPASLQQKAREEAERKRREQQQRKGQEKKDSSNYGALLFAVLRRTLAFVPLVCLILLGDSVFHFWLGHAGATWTSLTSGINGPVRAITGSPDGKILYACGTDTSSLVSAFLVSTDGGSTWTNHKTNEPSNCQSIALSPDGKKILIPAVSITGPQAQTSTATSAILSSNDGGSDWQTIQLEDVFRQLLALSAQNHAAAVPNVRSNSSAVYTFPLKKIGSLFDASEPYALPIQMRGIFSDGTRIMAVGQKGEIFGTKYQSTDIDAQDSGVNSSLNAVTGTPDGKFLIAVGDDGVYLETADWGISWRSGAIWHSPAGSVTPDLNAIFMTADGSLFASSATRHGLTSADEGAHWTIRYAGVGSNLFGVFGTANGKHLWAVGTGGMIVESNDSGVTWKQRPSGVKFDLYAVYGTSDGRRLWVVGDKGAILTSKHSLFF